MRSDCGILGCPSQSLQTKAQWSYKEGLDVEPLLGDALKKMVLVS